MTVWPPVSDADAGLWKHAEAGACSHAPFVPGQSGGIELATARIYRRILSDPANAAFHRAVAEPDVGSYLNADLIGIVPGAFYRTHLDTGADGVMVRDVADKLGCEAEVVPVAGFGTLEENAAAILDWLEARTHRRIALVSLSKGGADVKFALSSPRAGAAFAHVSAWINLSGIVQGTPLIEWLRRRFLRWWCVRFLLWRGGHDAKTLQQLRHGPDTPLAPWPSLPSHLRVVHVYGVPLRRHLAHRWAFRAYERLALLGPNDGGGVLLEDLLQFPGIVCPVWGADHYLKPAWDAPSLLRRIVTCVLSHPFQASQYDSAPITAPASKSTA